MYEKIPELDERLKTIYSMIGTVDSVADIGTDHGYLGGHLWLDGKAKSVQFCDISDKSLNKARIMAERIGMGEAAEFHVGDGMTCMRFAPDAVVIAGMGGETVAHILKNGSDALNSGRLLIQANVDIDQARSAIEHIGYRIDDERVVHVGRRFYVIMSAIPGRSAMDETDLLVGPVLRHENGDVFRAYSKNRFEILAKALAGISSGHQGNAVHVEELQHQKAIWEKFL